ncbi:MAG: hypothetical protein LBB26_04060 [Puniceicoccales bacterium]|jgi:hypothetical protein|nr:hypothetical protein [Puniceicoccales bacterium]
MSAPSSLTRNHADFGATFTGDGTDAKKRTEVAQKLASTMGLTSENMQVLIRLWDHFNALSGALKLSSEDQTKADMYKALWAAALGPGNRLDHSTATQTVIATLDFVPVLWNALQVQNLPIDPCDLIRLLSACTKVVCTIANALEKPSSPLAPRTTATPGPLRALADKFAGKLAHAKLEQNGINTQPGTLKDAEIELRQQRPAIGYYLNPQTGKVTYVELEIRNSLFGRGGYAAPKLGPDGTAHWMTSTPFVQSFKATPASPPVILANLLTPFKSYDDLPQGIKGVAATTLQKPYQQQAFLNEFNARLSEWEEAYKGAHADDLPLDSEALMKNIIEQETVKNEIAEMVQHAAAAPEPPSTP